MALERVESAGSKVLPFPESKGASAS
jgi:hypothetical protein